MLKIFIIFLYCLSRASCGHHPVLLVPGLGGTELFAKYISNSGVKLCNSINKSFQIWVDIKYFLPFRIHCAINLLKLEYNISGHSTHSPKYCEIEVPIFGKVDSIEYLTPLKIYLTAYYAKIIDALQSKLKYTRNVDIRGAPYDFRKGPNEMKSYLLNVKKLIEEMFRKSNGTSVVIIAHSMGGMHMVRLFNKMSQAWKDKYIRAFISISSPYAGAPMALESILSGVKSIAYFIKNIKLRQLERTWPSLYYLIPSRRLWSNDSLVLTKFGNFTAAKISKILKLSKIPLASEIYEDVTRDLPDVEAPGVETHCILGEGIKTVVALDYRKKQFPDEPPKNIMGDGDGTVPFQSMIICPLWKAKQRQVVTLHTVPKVNHFNMVKNRRIVDIITNIMSKINS